MKKNKNGIGAVKLLLLLVGLIILGLGGFYVFSNTNQESKNGAIISEAAALKLIADCKVQFVVEPHSGGLSIDLADGSFRKVRSFDRQKFGEAVNDTKEKCPSPAQYGIE